MQTVSKERLATAMIQRGVGTDSLSRSAGVNKRRVSELSNRGGVARNSTIFKLATALNIEPTDLIEPVEVPEVAQAGAR